MTVASLARRYHLPPLDVERSKEALAERWTRERVVSARVGASDYLTRAAVAALFAEYGIRPEVGQ